MGIFLSLFWRAAPANPSPRPSTPSRLPLAALPQRRSDLTALFMPKDSHAGYNMLRDSLRRVVFRIDDKSAVCITKHMMGQLTEQEVHEFIGTWREARLMVDNLNNRTDWDWNELLIELCPPFAKVFQTVQKFRRLHAKQLSEHWMRDVRITYSEGSIGQYMKDKEVIQSASMTDLTSNGIIYHHWPGDDYPRSLSFDALLRADVLERLLPTERIEREGIVLTVNTMPAGSSDGDRDEHTGTIFPNYRPDLSRTPLRALSPGAREFVEDEMENIMNSLEPERSLEIALAVPVSIPYWHRNNFRGDVDLDDTTTSAIAAGIGPAPLVLEDVALMAGDARRFVHFIPAQPQPPAWQAERLRHFARRRVEYAARGERAPFDLRWDGV